MNQLVKEAIDRFPATFALRGFKGDLCRISPDSSYINDGGVLMLYIDAWSTLGWANLAKCTEPELEREFNMPQILDAARLLHQKAPGTWIRTNTEITAIHELRPFNHEQPRDGMLWWRTHHLFRTLGGLI